jgi:hypothetical protein
MNYENILTQLDHHINKNNDYFRNIHSILYFNDETFIHNPNFLNEKYDNEKTYTIEIRKLNKNEILDKVESNFKNYSQFIEKFFQLNNYNLSQSYQSITECILNVIDYKLSNGKNELFRKMIRENDAINFFNKFHYKKRKLCRKNQLRNLLIEKSENNKIIIQFLCDYLNINLLILENNKYNLYSQNDEFELYKITVMLYKYDNKYYYFINNIKNKQIYTSDDNINYRIKYNLFVKNNNFILKNKKSNDIKLSMTNILENTKEKTINKKYNKIKVIDLKKMCKERKIKGYSKLNKSDLIKLLNI